MSSQAQKRKASHNFVHNGCDKETDKNKRFYWYGKKKRYEEGKRYVKKAFDEWIDDFVLIEKNLK